MREFCSCFAFLILNNGFLSLSFFPYFGRDMLGGGGSNAILVFLLFVLLPFPSMHLIHINSCLVVLLKPCERWLFFLSCFAKVKNVG